MSNKKMIATEIISEYINLCNSVTDIITNSGYRIDYVCEKMGLSQIGFYKKRKKGTFKPEELLLLFKIIEHSADVDVKPLAKKK